MHLVEINRDMDHAGMSALRPSFDELARGSQDVCLDLANVEFLDSAGLSQMSSLFHALRQRSLQMAIVRAHGQPLRLLRDSALARTGVRLQCKAA